MAKKGREQATYQGVVMVRGKRVGFVTLPDHKEDIMIPTEALGVALNGDTVEVTLDTAKKERRETGRVVRIIERGQSEYIGTVTAKGSQFFLHHDNRRIQTPFLLPRASKDMLGMKVAVKLTKWKDQHIDPLAEIIEVLGKAGEHETEMQAIIRSGGFASGFPKEVEQQADKLYKAKQQIFKDALADPKRRDFRDVPTCTIDPKDAKDFDDAISFRELKNGNHEIGIHIADVSHYIKENDPIDKEAQERGTSIYLVDRVIPMLPEILSNDLCSLRPNEDRLTFSAVFEIDTAGAVHKSWYGQTVIHSNKRFTYEEAQKVAESKKGPLSAELITLMDISRILREKRYKEGAIAFEQPEVKFELDENGKPLRAYTKERTETMLMIEDYMLLANRMVAEHIYKLCKDKRRDEAFVYRVHDVPDEERVEELAVFLHALGYEFKIHKDIVEAADINKLLKEIKGTPEENLIKIATIRTMAKAVYSTKNIGHFGLAFRYYTHFTSPIRRYPDMMTHRLLRRHLDGSRISGKELSKYEKLSVQSSEREMSAVEAERDSIKFKQVEFMSDKIGQEFDAIISGVTDWGIYVEEKEAKAEGMVTLASIKSDYFTYDSKNYRVVGERTKKKYALGDKVRVKLTAASPEERTLDFMLV